MKETITSRSLDVARTLTIKRTKASYISNILNLYTDIRWDQKAQFNTQMG